MGTRHTLRAVSRAKVSLLAVVVGILCIFGVLGLAGCTTPAAQPPDNGGTAIASEEVKGTITEILESELLVEISESTAVGLQQGRVRVDTSQIDSELVKSLKVGDKITFEFSGIMGMSEPPFVSATSLEVVK